MFEKKSQSRPFQVLVEPNGTRLVLSRRDLGRWRLVGLVPIFVGLIFVKVAINNATDAFGEQNSPSDPFMLFALLPVVLSLIAAAISILVGAFFFLGRSEILITQERIKVIERVGPFRKTFRRALSELTKVTIMAPAMRLSDRPTGASSLQGFQLKDLSAIHMAFGEKSHLLVAVGYHLPLLHEVVAELAEHVDQIDLQEVHVAHGDEVTDLSGNEVIEEDEVPEQPADSKALLTFNEGGLSIVLPPLGILKGSSGLFTFSIVWLLITSVMFLIMLFGSSGSGNFWAGLGFLTLFLAIGVVTLLIAINMGKRSALIDVVGDTLLITQQGLFGAKQNEWPVAELEDICLGSSNMEVNGRTLMCLHVVTGNDEREKFFTARDDEELVWVAAVLRKALGVGLRVDPAQREED